MTETKITKIADKKVLVVRTTAKESVYNTDELLEVKADIIAKHEANLAELDAILNAK